jgi:hypothetical protein
MNTNKKTKIAIATLTLVINLISFLLITDRLNINLINEAQAVTANSKISVVINFSMNGHKLNSDTSFIQTQSNSIRTLKLNSVDFLPKLKSSYKSSYRKTVSQNKPMVLLNGPSINFAQTAQNGTLRQNHKITVSNKNASSDPLYIAQGHNLDSIASAKSAFKSVSSQNQDILTSCQTGRMKPLSINQATSDKNCNFVVAVKDSSSKLNLLFTAN